MSINRGGHLFEEIHGEFPLMRALRKQCTAAVRIKVRRKVSRNLGILRIADAGVRDEVEDGLRRYWPGPLPHIPVAGFGELHRAAWGEVIKCNPCR